MIKPNSSFGNSLAVFVSRFCACVCACVCFKGFCTKSPLTLCCVQCASLFNAALRFKACLSAVSPFSAKNSSPWCIGCAFDARAHSCSKCLAEEKKTSDSWSMAYPERNKTASKERRKEAKKIGQRNQLTFRTVACVQTKQATHGLPMGPKIRLCAIVLYTGAELRAVMKDERWTTLALIANACTIQLKYQPLNHQLKRPKVSSLVLLYVGSSANRS